jgi:hypothetical protein
MPLEVGYLEKPLFWGENIFGARVTEAWSDCSCPDFSLPSVLNDAGHAASCFDRPEAVIAGHDELASVRAVKGNRTVPHGSVFFRPHTSPQAPGHCSLWGRTLVDHAFAQAVFKRLRAPFLSARSGDRTRLRSVIAYREISVSRGSQAFRLNVIAGATCARGNGLHAAVQQVPLAARPK